MTQDRAPYWTGREGAAYVARQTLDIASRAAMFGRIFDAMIPCPASVIEFGASVGDNLRAIRRMSAAKLVGVEVNEDACAILHSVADGVYCSTLQSFVRPVVCDLAFTRGVLIHIPPDELPQCYDTLYRCSRRYILIAEYYSPQPVEIEYRGQMGLLWKRDFAGDMLDRSPDLRLLDYGFVYHRDPVAAQDDVTWFLMEKRA